MYVLTICWIGFRQRGHISPTVPEQLSHTIACPHGTSTVSTSRSKQTLHILSLLSSVIGADGPLGSIVDIDRVGDKIIEEL